ncbi:hypothetical protein E0Z10_g8585 [Xylaria hypoxylon]|uniref:BZIP domain-containing protein n=1 Tax=Xylaria hypoxylon TaxID=37992 RepID=A0A4Z0YRJ4_9PEZI|nr:hypothetical protein E0Z10_g8585 [Xylaria hypoxylon]
MATVDKSSPENGYQKPSTRQRIQKEAPTLAVPDINDDAAERKRILNVLAQRRYRERKRHEKGRGTAKRITLTPQSNLSNNRSSSPMREDAMTLETPTVQQEPSISAYLDFLPDLDPDPAPTSLEFVSDVGSHARWPTASFEAAAGNLLPGIEASYINMADPSLSTLQMEGLVIGTEANTFGFLDNMDSSTLLDSSSSSPSVSDNSESTELSFPDSYYLPVNELTLLRGLMRIAMRLRCNTTKIWELGANSPFNDGTHTALTTQELPQVWRPTVSQSSIPHHPVIDLLPWPNVRDRIILLMGLPDEARPPSLAGPLAIAQLAYDLEDTAEGVRIWGDDPCEPTAWEIGQVLFERWWFVFDRQVIDQSNYWRKLRGAATLCIES